jgi:uncharacterized protein YbjT (DUF2867 family)
MKTVLITGATGAIGRALVLNLARRRIRVRAVARSIQSRDFPAGVSYLNADLSEPEILAQVLDGVDALFVHPRAVGAMAPELVALAAEHGVQRLVALSALDVEEDLALQPSRFIGDRNREVEEAVSNSGLSWVCIRAPSYTSYILDLFAAQVRVGDVVRGPCATFAECPVHERDLVDVLGLALLDGEIKGRRVEVTGPESLTHQEVVDVIGAVIARPLRFEEVPSGVIASQLVAGGLPTKFAAALVHRWERDRDRRPTATEEVLQLTGHPARGFNEWVAAHAASFALSN